MDLLFLFFETSTQNRSKEAMDEPSRYQKFKQHLQRNKTRYLIGGTAAGSFVVGGATMAAFGKVDVKQTVDSFKLIHIQWKSPNNINVAMVKNACPDPIPVLDKETGIPYPSMRYAAKATQQAYDYIRKDVHGAQKRFAELPNSVFA